MGEEVIWEIWRRLENSRLADFIQTGVADCSLGVFEGFVGVRIVSQTLFVPNFSTGCSIA